MLELNKNIITSYELMNKVTTYINHMDKIAKKYDLEFNGFNLAKWEIITNVKVISDKHIIAYEKIRDFISKYRLDSNRLFELEFINSFEWMDNIKFRVNFKIK